MNSECFTLIQVKLNEFSYEFLSALIFCQLTLDAIYMILIECRAPNTAVNVFSVIEMHDHIRREMNT